MQNLKKFLDLKVKEYNNPNFIAQDPICIPHLFSKPQDIEIAGFFAATLAWGNRTSIINSCKKLLLFMDNSPHQFITQHTSADLKPMQNFVHRTFNATDLLYFIEFLKMHFSQNNSLQNAFTNTHSLQNINVENALTGFNKYFFSLEFAPQRTQKHVASPAKKSACKRLNMYLRWMVRSNETNVDFGLWKNILPAQLICPLDVHVANVACRLGLLENNNSNWNNAVTLTQKLKKFDKNDPAKYDFALFTLGVIEKFK